MTTTRAFVFARGGSKGIPNKNLLPIAGLPMLAHSILLAKKINEIERVYVSTDSEDICKVAQFHGATIINRPADLSGDHSPEWLAWQHAIKKATENHGPFDKFISLPATAPLRQINDVHLCLEALKPGVDIVLTATKAHRSPWFNMVAIDSSGFARLVADDFEINRRQDAPVCFDMTTVAYVSRPEYILSAKGIWDGKVVAVNIPIERSIDIDTPFDFAVAQFLMENRNSLGDITT